ncbi:hypothetical protein, partial [Mesorhizobium sp. M4B.F.Ca.ET.200.01.1.1]|uniref:hypothetical protein n=1 Tax=Mesorhizobium sp. M4B.F.Ca.ET.200.01.1.1 TaxID=2563952 RepID=UPI001AEE7B2A
TARTSPSTLSANLFIALPLAGPWTRLSASWAHRKMPPVLAEDGRRHCGMKNIRGGPARENQLEVDRAAAATVSGSIKRRR